MPDETTEAPNTMAQESTPVQAPESTPVVSEPKEESIADILAYDPFEPKSGEVGKPEGDEGKETKEPPAPAATPAPSGETPPAEAKPEPKPEDTSGLKTVLEQILESQRSNQPAPAPVEEQKPEPQKPRFNVAIPEPILAGIRSDDPAESGAAMNGLVNGVMNAVHSAVLEHIEKQVFPRMREIVEVAQQSKTAQQEFHDQFYGKYPELNKGELKPFIFMTAQMVMREEGRSFQGITPAFQEKVANRIKDLMKLGGASQQQQPPQVPPAKKQFNSGKATRTEEPQTVSKEIMSTLFG